MCVHQCPHCDYSTTGPKNGLIAHIHAKHTKDEDKPFQCKICQKGFAQKSNYHKHLQRVHNIEIEKPKNDKDIFLYIITPGSKMPTTKKVIERFNKYMSNPIVIRSKINDYKISENETLTYNKLYYDKQSGIINLKSLTEYDAKNWKKPT